MLPLLGLGEIYVNTCFENLNKESHFLLLDNTTPHKTH